MKKDLIAHPGMTDFKLLYKFILKLSGCDDSHQQFLNPWLRLSTRILNGLAVDCISGKYTLMIALKHSLDFDWNQGNVRKSTDKHGVIQSKADQLFFNDPLLRLPDTLHTTEPRFHTLKSHLNPVGHHPPHRV